MTTTMAQKGGKVGSSGDKFHDTSLTWLVCTVREGSPRKNRSTPKVMSKPWGTSETRRKQKTQSQRSQSGNLYG